MRKFFSIICFACMLISTTAFAQKEISINYSGSSATVTIPEGINDVLYTVNGAYVAIVSTTIASEYTYKVCGNTDNGGLSITGNYKLTLKLSGVNIQSQQGEAINVQCGKRIAVILDEGTVNTLSDSQNGSQKAAMYFSGHPEFEGGGILNVTGNTGHAISAKEYMTLKKTTGTINILGAVKDGIHCGKGKVNNENNYFQISGGVVNIDNVGSDCIDADDFGRVNVKGGVLNLNVRNDFSDGIKCDSIFNMTGGTVNILLEGNDAHGIRTNYSGLFAGGKVAVTVKGNGSKAIKGKSIPTGTVTGGSILTFDGTDAEIMLCCDDIIDNGERLKKTRGIGSDMDIIYNSGLINIYAYGDIENAFAADGTLTINGETLSLYRAPWKFCKSDYQYDMSSYVRLKISNNIISSNYANYAIGAFAGDECVGIAIPCEDDDAGYLRICSNSTTNETITFAVYDYNNNKYIPIKTTTTFQNSTALGTEISPFILETETMTSNGDVNGDGEVDIADVAALVSIMLGISEDIYNAADVNNDTNINIYDMNELVNILLDK